MAKRKTPIRRTTSTKVPRERVCIDFAILGDFAQVANGKLTVVGAGWNIINAQQYPQNVNFGLGIGILVPWGDTNTQHPFGFAIQDADGNQLVSGGGQVEAGRQAGMPAGMYQRVVFAIAGQLTLPRPGTYVVLVTAAGDEKKITFEALPVPGLRMSPT